MVIGHETIRERLRRSAENRRAAHAYLFSGPENVGKLAIALEFSESLLGAAASISNRMILRPERVEEKGKVKELPISVKNIRDAVHTLGLSNSGGGSALLIDDAHKMSESAQNAFLKTLEEPFSGRIILLVTHDEGSVLPTILSRCERVPFSLVESEVLEKFFPDVPEALRRLGRPGLCVSFRESPEAFSEPLRRLEMLRSFRSLPMSDRADIADLCANDITRAEQLLSWWISELNQELISNPPQDKRESLRLLHTVSTTLRDIRRFPGSARITLEQLFLFGKAVLPLFSRTMTGVEFLRLR